MILTILKTLAKKAGIRRFWQGKLNYFQKTFQQPRWGYEKPSHPLLYDIIDKGRDRYIQTLTDTLTHKEQYLKISAKQDGDYEPFFETPWLPPLDSFSLYAFVAHYKPATYIEIGSGNSTKFTRRSIIDNNLSTRIISIDPQPRAEIDQLCDEAIRKPAESVDLEIFDQLNENDILFIDNSHRCFMNSDVTTVFIDIIPRLKPGVIVEIHDIFLPNDYPPQWGKRYYSEQYLLAAYLLAQGDKFEILLPNAFISGDTKLHEILNPVYSDPRWPDIGFGGGSFWLRMN